MNYYVLLGVLIIVLGFIFKLDVVAVVLLSGLVTGLVSGMPLLEVLDTIGKGFVSNRYMSLFFISLPIIAITERYGLKDRAKELVSKIKAASAGSVAGIYIILRWIASCLSIRFGGIMSFVRPIILPMAEGAAAKNGKVTEKISEDLKGLLAAMENYGNFYGQNIFPVASGVLLIQGTLKEAGYNITNEQIVNGSLISGIAMIVLALIQCYLFEKKFRREQKKDV